MSVMVKTVIVMESPRWLWLKPMWWCILKLKTEKAPRRFSVKTDVVFLLFYCFSKAPHRLAGLNRYGGELHDVDCLTDV